MFTKYFACVSIDYEFNVIDFYRRWLMIFYTMNNKIPTQRIAGNFVTESFSFYNLGFLLLVFIIRINSIVNSTKIEIMGVNL